MLAPLLLLSGLLAAAIPACQQDDSVYRSGTVPPSIGADGGAPGDGTAAPTTDTGGGTD